MKTFWKILFVCSLAAISIPLVQHFYGIGFRGGFEWGLRSVPPPFQEPPNSTEIYSGSCSY
jgi:hypothetical protein